MPNFMATYRNALQHTAIHVRTFKHSDSETKATQKLYAYLIKYAEFNDKLAAAAAAEDSVAALKAWKGGYVCVCV